MVKCQVQSCKRLFPALQNIAFYVVKRCLLRCETLSFAMRFIVSRACSLRWRQYGLVPSVLCRPFWKRISGWLWGYWLLTDVSAVPSARRQRCRFPGGFTFTMSRLNVKRFVSTAYGVTLVQRHCHHIHAPHNQVIMV